MVRIENLAVPGSTSADLRAAVDGSLRPVLAGADAVLVTTGRNDPQPGRTGANVDAVLTAIERVRRGRPTLVRVAAADCGAARRDRVPCADIRGVDLARDGVHPSPRGHREIAAALERLGFSPLAGTGSP
jgi:lysophospholipase L1-like esterase